MFFTRTYRDYLSYGGFEHHCIGTQLKFTLLPKRCFITGKLLWLKYAYKQTAMWTGPGEPIFECRWADKVEFLIYKLQK